MNNYDRMHRGEPKPRLPENKARKVVNKRRKRALRIVESVLSVAFLFILLILFDVFGTDAANALYGVFGVAAIPYSMVGILVCILLFFGAKPKRLKPSTVVYIIFLSVILVCFLQTITTGSVYNSLEEISYSAYLKGCFNTGRNNAGGYLYGIIAYPFLQMGAITSTCILAVLFFGVLLFAFRSFFFIEKNEVENVEEAGLYVEDILEKTKSKKNKGVDINLSFPNDTIPDPEEEEIEEAEINYADSSLNSATGAIRRMLEAETDEKNRARMASDVLFMSDEAFKSFKQPDPIPEDLPVKTGERAPTQPAFGDSFDVKEVTVNNFAARLREGKLDGQAASDILFGEDATLGRVNKPISGDRRSLAEDILFGEEVKTSYASPRYTVPLSASDSAVSSAKRDDSSKGFEMGGREIEFPPYMGTGYSPSSPSNNIGATPINTDSSNTLPNNEVPNNSTPSRDFSIPASPIYDARAVSSKQDYTPRVEPSINANSGSDRRYEGPVENKRGGFAYSRPNDYTNQPTEENTSNMPDESSRVIGNSKLYEHQISTSENQYFSASLEQTDYSSHSAENQGQANTTNPMENSASANDASSSTYDRTARSSSPDENITPENAYAYEPEINDEMEEYKPRQMFRPDDIDEKPENDNQIPQPQTGFVARKVEPIIEEEPVVPEKKEAEKPQQNPTLNKKPSWQKVKKPLRPYAFPPLSLLKDYMPPIDTIDYEDFYNRIEQAFASYDLKCRVIGHTKGATYTQYALKFADGVVFRKVASLENDIKRKLCVDKAISIVNSVKGMDAIGLETVNSTRERVGLKQYITHSVFKKDKKLYFMLGVNVYKESYFCNILEAPHLLIAGTTGSGKSICINTIICSIIYNYSPDYVKFVLVDPKSVELSAFAEIPHNLLGCPVITADDCIKALEAVIEEMERRYALMNLAQCKQLTTYNDYLKANGQQPLPYIVVIIDELADLMLSSKKNAPELEKRISKLTAKSRAAGIHLIIATQRPSIDVLTGVIKNNIPTRIAFTMGDAVGSKVVLDRGGAEKLYGKGDMLFSSPDYPDFVRLQAPFLDESEVTEITDYVKANNDCDFDEDLRAKIFESNDQTDPLYESDYVAGSDNSQQDTLFSKAVRFAVSQGVISISKIQRQYRIGFTRAAYIFDEMVKRGIVDEAVPGSSKPRAVLIGEADLPSVLGDLDEQD